MKMSFRVFVVMVLAASTMAGCVMKSTTSPGVMLNLNAQRSDYQILAPVEGTGKAVQVFGIPFSGSQGYIAKAPVPLIGLSGLACGAATFKAMENLQDADAVLPISYTVKHGGIPFFFSVYVADFKGKAIKIKTD